MRSSYVALAAIGLAVGGLWYAAGTGVGPRPAVAAESVRVSAPVAHDNLAVYFVHGPDAVTNEKVVTLQEALEKNWVVVHETGNVNELALENRSPDHDLFLQSGDMVKGGKQDRIVSTDLLVPPGSGRVPLPSHCVEQSRWRQRGAEAASHFHASDGIVSGKALKAANIARDQARVWENVAENQAKLNATTGVIVNDPRSPTSLQLALDNPAVRARANAYVAALKDRTAAGGNVVGAVFVVNGRVSGAEVYGSSRLFRKAWPKLLKSAAEEALAERAAGPAPTPPTPREVERFLANASKPDAPATGGRVEGLESEVPANAPELLGRGGANRLPVLNAAGGRAVQAGEQQFIDVGGRVTGNRVNVTSVGQRFAEPQQAAAQALSYDNVGSNFGNPRHQNATRMAPQPATVTQPAGNGNRLDVTRAENARVLMLEARDAAKPGAVIHRSYLTK